MAVLLELLGINKIVCGYDGRVLHASLCPTERVGKTMNNKNVILSYCPLTGFSPTYPPGSTAIIF
ncbi:hypothetical protein clem_04680 [Legionella clemsonensis]|uniref:Uncharacterized protein n=1 Tax=Legionella clemsonensis TaxID=1867846 RepID=A0A222P0Y2_9GAMM|nr:hypothetical protein clem_04680 [Legionella clemsonensis]